MIKFDPETGALECPCGNFYTHHNRVAVYNRKHEDSAEGQRVIVAGGGVIVDGIVSQNPSSRRNGLTLAFECEDCDTLYELQIAQHKGCTYMDFVLAGTHTEPCLGT